MTDEMEKTQRKIKDAVNNMVDDMDKSHLRELQRQMFACSARCCEDRAAGRQEMEQCVEQCGSGMRKAQTLLETELNGLQDQLSRCAMTCYDKQIQQNGPDPSKYDDKQMERFQANLNKCVSLCGDQHTALLPKIRDRVIKALRNLS